MKRHASIGKPGWSGAEDPAVRAGTSGKYVDDLNPDGACCNGRFSFSFSLPSPCFPPSSSARAVGTDASSRKSKFRQPRPGGSRIKGVHRGSSSEPIQPRFRTMSGLPPMLPMRLASMVAREFQQKARFSSKPVMPPISSRLKMDCPVLAAAPASSVLTQMLQAIGYDSPSSTSRVDIEAPAAPVERVLRRAARRRRPHRLLFERAATLPQPREPFHSPLGPCGDNPMRCGSPPLTPPYNKRRENFAAPSAIFNYGLTMEPARLLAHCGGRTAKGRLMAGPHNRVRAAGTRCRSFNQGASPSLPGGVRIGLPEDAHPTIVEERRVAAAAFGRALRISFLKKPRRTFPSFPLLPRRPHNRARPGEVDRGKPPRKNLMAMKAMPGEAEMGWSMWRST